MKLLTVLVLVLATGMSAVVLHWDDGTYGEAIRYSRLAVLFHDHEGPGDTGGRPGEVSRFIARFAYYAYSQPPEFYIFSRDGDDPGEELSGPLEYSTSHQGEGGWFIFTLEDPVEVPGEFFAVVKPFGTTRVVLDLTSDWDFPHSRYLRDGQWLKLEKDLLFRVEWEPLDASVEGTSWGWIKAEGPLP